MPIDRFDQSINFERLYFSVPGLSALSSSSAGSQRIMREFALEAKTARPKIVELFDCAARAKNLGGFRISSFSEGVQNLRDFRVSREPAGRILIMIRKG